MSHSLLILSENDIHNLLSMKECIKVMENVFSRLSNNELSMPVRMVTDFDETAILYKPAASKKEDIVGIKLLSQVNTNRTRGLPVIQGLILLINYTDGRYLSLMDGSSVTAIRTGAAAGLATKLLSNPLSKTGAIFGAGVQGRTQLLAICEVRNLEKVYIFDNNEQSVKQFIQEMQPKCKATLVPAYNLEVLETVDVICTVTPTPEPLFDIKHLKDGVHINAMGSFKPDMNEISPAIVANSLLYVDHAESVISESGDIIKPIRQGIIDESFICGEIGDLINRKIKSRVNDNQITLFKSVGVAVQDLAAANFVYQQALKTGTGQTINL